MSAVPNISKNDVQNWVGVKSFQRGNWYYEDESILNPRRRGQSLIAECQGSQTTPYRVEIQFGPEGIQGGSCTCPAGQGGHCKHAAALLLTWLNEPASFDEVPELETLLEKHSKSKLISLIQEMVARHPDLEQLLEISALSDLAVGEPVRTQWIAQQVHRAFSSVGGETGADNSTVAENLQPILDAGEDMLDQQDVANASAIYQTVIDNMLIYDDCLYHDDGGDLGQVLAECEQGLEACLQSAADENLRQRLLRTLFDLFVWDLQAGGLGYADETPSMLIAHSTPAEKQQIATWIQEDLGQMEDGELARPHQRALGGLWLDLIGNAMDDQTYLEICRATGRTRDLCGRLLTLGRIDEAQTIAQTAARHEVTHFADLFVQHGHGDLALEFVKEQVERTNDLAFLQWLKQYAQEHNDPQEALRLAGTLFWQSQTLRNYQELLECAETLRRRDAVRARILERLENAGNFSLLVEVYLSENEVDLALAALERVNPDIWPGRMGGLRRQVAQAVEIPRPREAIRQYLLLIDNLISKRSRGSYAEAARLLQQVHKLYHGLGEEAHWQQIIRSVHQEYHRLPALLDELHRAGIAV